MDDKDNIKQALLKFATSLGISDEVIRESYKKDVVESLDKQPKKNQRKSPRSKKKKSTKPVDQKQLTSLLSNYTEALGSDDGTREKSKQDVLDAFSAQMQAENIIAESGLDHDDRQKQVTERTQIFNDYLDGIDTAFDSKSNNKQPDKESLLSEEIQQYIDGRVDDLNNQFQQMKISNATAVDGGGGSVAKQLGAGGKVDGNLNIQGQIKPSGYYSGESKEVLDDATLTVNQPGSNDLAEFSTDGVSKVHIDNEGNTTITKNLSVYENIYVGGSIQGTINVNPGGGSGGKTDEDLVPKTDDTYTLGTSAKTYKQLHVQAISADNMYLSGGLIVDGETVQLNSEIESNLVPVSGAGLQLGTTTNQWQQLHVHDINASGDTTIDGTLDVSNLTVQHVLSTLTPLTSSLNLGTQSSPWDNLHANNIQVAGSSTLSGDVTLGDSVGSDVTINGKIASDLIPDTNVLNIGSVSDPWNHAHVYDASISNDLSVLGNTTLGVQASADQLAIRAWLTTNVTPVTGQNLTLGTAANQWQTLHVVDNKTSGNLSVDGSSTLSGDVHVMGDLRVDGNTYLSAASGGQINVGDDAQDLVIFKADVGSHITPNTSDTYNLGAPDKHWNTIHTRDVSATNNMMVSGDAVFGPTGNNTNNVVFNSDIDSDIEPAHHLHNLGNIIQPWNTLHVQNVSASNNMTVSGDMIVGSDNTDTVDIKSQVSSNIIPVSGNNLNLGTSNNQWNTVNTQHVRASQHVTAGGNLSISGTSTLSGDVHVFGDLRVDGNAYLSAGSGGQINVGDSDGDNVIFNADVASHMTPDQDVTYNLGSSDKKWSTLHVHDVSATGNVSISGDTVIGSTNTDTVNFNADISSDIIPNVDATHDIGKPTKTWNDVHTTNIYNTGSVTVTGNSTLKGNTTVGTTTADFLDVYALVGTDLIPEFTNTTQQYTTLVTGATATPTGAVDNLFDIDTANGWTVANDGGNFTINMDIELPVPITGTDEYEWRYTTNSSGGDRVVYLRDSTTGTWHELTKETGGGGNRTSASQLVVTSPFRTMEIDGIRFQYQNTVNPGGEDFTNHYFVLKKDNVIIDWRDLTLVARWDLGSDSNPWGSIHGTDGNLTNTLMVSGDATIRGDVIIGTDNFNDVTIHSDIASDLDPNLDNTYTLGNEVQRWKTLYTTGVSTTGLSANGMVYPTSDGELGQAIVTDGAGTLSFGSPNRLDLPIRNEETFNLSPGDPIYAQGEVGSSGVIRVGRADNTDPAKMPAIGIVTSTITTGADGTAVTNGVWNYNLSGLTGVNPGDTLYVAQNGLTNIKPTGGNVDIQNMGQVLRVNANVIHGIKVASIDRSNDVPNLSAGHIFYSSNGATEQTALTAAIAAQPVIETQILNSGQLLSGGKDIRIDFDTIDQRISGLYNYLVSNSVNNHTVSSNNLNDFITSEYPTLSTTAQMGDTITLSASNDVYVLSNNIGDTNDDWVLATLKPTTYITDSSMSHEKIIDSFLLIQHKSAKYIIEVEDLVSGEMFFTELSVITNGSTFSITPWGLNYTTTAPFVEFDAVVNANSLSLKILQASGFNNIASCRLKATRTNL